MAVSERTHGVSMDRRREDQHLDVLNTLLVEVSQLRQEVSQLVELKVGLQAHIVEETAFQNKLLAIATEAFVDGDPTLHRMDHEARIQRTKLCKAFWTGLLAKLGEKTFFSLITVLGLLIVYWISGHQILVTTSALAK